MRSTRSLSIANVLEQAKLQYIKNGAVPLDISTKLMGLGVNMETVEAKWAEELQR